jgi:Uma2 family endonuclease
MVVAKFPVSPSEPRYAGLRMTAADYLALEPDGFRYELIDGLVVMSPSPTPEHQDVRGEIEYQLRAHERLRRTGWVLSELDVRLSDKLVYRPDLVYVRAERLSRRPRRIDSAPALVVEVLSPGTSSLDQTTKMADYARAGVTEYWIVDTARAQIRFLRLDGGTYAEVAPEGDRFRSVAVPGFVLDVAAVRAACSDALEP